MKQNVLQNVISFVLKYIWLFCSMLIILELMSVSYTAGILMQQSTLGVMQSVSGEVTGRVNGVLRLLTGMSNDERYADSTKSLYERITKAMPYQESYNLYMLALTDKDFNVVSADEPSPPTEFFNLGFRDYMKKLAATGKYQITDAFPAGVDNKTMNYTIAVPILKDGVLDGTVFGSIYFQNIEDILERNSQDNSRQFYMMGENNTIMTGGKKSQYGQSLHEVSKGAAFFGCDVETINSNMSTGKAGGCWEWGKEGLVYMTYQRVDPTNWTIVYRVPFTSMLIPLLPVLCVKIFFYILMCAAVHFLGRRYLSKHLDKINHLLNRMATIQKELFQSEQPDYDNLLDITQTGLTDQLTGLSTRAVLFRKMMQFTNTCNAYGAVVFVDLDDLKRINDNFGHEGGDFALLHFAKILKEYEQKHGAIAARYGGDEFILIFNAVDEKVAREIAESLCAELSTTITTKDHTFPIHGSLGISFYPEHGTTPEDLICKADLALYVAKQAGKNQCAFYTNDTAMT